MPEYFHHLTDAGVRRIAFPEALPLADRAAYMAAPPADAIEAAELLPAYAPPMPAPPAAPVATEPVAAARKGKTTTLPSED